MTSAYRQLAEKITEVLRLHKQHCETLEANPDDELALAWKAECECEMQNILMHDKDVILDALQASDQIVQHYLAHQIQHIPAVLHENLATGCA